MGTLRQKIRHIWEHFNRGETLPLAQFSYDLREAGYSLPPKPNTLCKSCWNGPFGAYAAWLFDVSDASQKTKMYPYFDTWENIESRAQTGCAGCRFFSEHNVNDQRGPAMILITVGLGDDSEVAPLALPTGMHMLAVSAREDTDVDRPWWVCYAYALNDEHPSAPYTNMHAPLVDVGSTRAFALVRGLLLKCETEHERCRNIATAPEETRLPKRLIDCTNPNRPRLVESSEGECGRYIALSYVWGGDQPQKTTRSNLRKYGRRIALKHLPQTIRDVIRVAHGLGFERLWVDSLCIVQDADDEKQHEIGRMHHIYRYAALTIVAARARHAGEGFLHDCEPSLFDGGPCMSVPILCAPTTPATVPRLGTITVYDEVMLEDRSRNFVQHEPIDERAWCLQERLISPRLLFFTSAFLQFRCQTATRITGTSYNDQDRQPRLPDALFLQSPSLPPLADDTSSGLISQSWLMVVNEYTRRSTTEPSDRLVACAAIAEAFHPILGDSKPKEDYLAGLWRRSLLTDLLWKAGDKNGRNWRPTQYRAPSWSWAAVDGGVDMLDISDHFESDMTAVAEVIRCAVSLKNGLLPFGEVFGGSLVLRAQLLQLTGASGVFDRQFNPGEQLLRVRWPYSTEVEDTVGRSSNAWHKLVWGEWYDDSDGVQVAQPHIPLWAIPLSIHGKRRLRGLIIAHAHLDGSDSPGSRTLYHRIGHFRMRCDDMDENQHVLVRPLKNGEVPLQEIEII